MNTPYVAPHDFSCSGVKLDQCIIGFPATMKVAGSRVFKGVFDTVCLELLNSVVDPFRVFRYALPVLFFGVQVIPAVKTISGVCFALTSVHGEYLFLW